MDDPATDDLESLTRVPDLWFPLDTLVIRAENKIFRVSQGVLAARSSVFSDMVGFPQAGNIDRIDGCPVVQLYDLADDVEVFLRAIFDSNYFMPAPAPINLSSVLGILRLSHKYDVQYLYRRALDHLHCDGWYKRTWEDFPLSTDHLSADEAEVPSNPISVIAAATEVNALWLLPCAYYYTSNYKPGELLSCITPKTETVIRVCLEAQKSFVRATIAVNDFLTTYSACRTDDMCNRVRSDQLKILFADVARGEDLTPLSEWPEERWEDLAAAGLCPDCHTRAKARNRLAASAFHENLPALFGLPPWDELNAMKRAAMGDEAAE
ncbi:hypothetical protein C8R46DRAFT_935640 [Mycena filopes]|nr:hypothetical protein C8R46DRAFT_935640 [Mycena filopes]